MKTDDVSVVCVLCWGALPLAWLHWQLKLKTTATGAVGVIEWALHLLHSLHLSLFLHCWHGRHPSCALSRFVLHAHVAGTYLESRYWHIPVAGT